MFFIFRFCLFFLFSFFHFFRSSFPSYFSFSRVLKICVFFFCLKHDFLQHLSLKQCFWAVSGRYSIEASFLFFPFLSCFFLWLFLLFSLFLKHKGSFRFCISSKYVLLLALVSEFNCFLRGRCSMEMWCPDDIGRDTWDWIGPPAGAHDSTPQSGVDAPRLWKRSLSKLYCCYCCFYNKCCNQSSIRNAPIFLKLFQRKP